MKKLQRLSVGRLKPEYRESFEDDLIEIENNKEHAKEVLLNLMSIKKEIEEKKEKLDQEWRYVEKMKKETQIVRSCTQEEWQRAKVHAKRLNSVFSQLAKDCGSISGDTGQTLPNLDLSLIIEEWKVIEQARTEAASLRSQAQSMLEFATRTLQEAEATRKKVEVLQSEFELNNADIDE
jgi:hypothetical protein